MITNRITGLPNPHANCVRELLKSLTCFENEYGRKTIELRNTKEEYARKMDTVVFPYTNARKMDPITKCVDLQQARIDFQANAQRADEIADCYNKRISMQIEEREKLLLEAKRCLISLRTEKCNFKRFHERSMSELKRVFGSTMDPKVRNNCQKDINVIGKMFCDEVAFVQKCEMVLQPFIHLLSNDCNVKDTCVCNFRKYEWIPAGKDLSTIEDMVKMIKSQVGIALKRSFAKVHIHRPADMKIFLARYLMNLEHNEQLMAEKLEIYKLCQDFPVYVAEQQQQELQEQP